MITAEDIARGLEKGKRSGKGWMACCPAHNDNNPSLLITDSDRGYPTFHCFAGCDGASVIRELRDLGLWKTDFDNNARQRWQDERDRLEAEYDGLVDSLRDKLATDEERQQAVLEYLNDGVEPTKFVPATVRQFRNFQESLPPREYLIDGIPMGSVGVIAAQPGVGKSMLAMGIAVAVSRGGAIGAWQAHKKRKVLILDVELETMEMGERLESYGEVDNIYLDWEDWRRKFGVGSFELGNQEHHQILQEIVEELDIDLVVLDNVTFCLTTANPNTFDPSVWAQVIPLMSWFRANRKALIFVDHTNKGGDIAGSANKQRSVDFALKLEASVNASSETLEFDLAFTKYRYKKEEKHTWARTMTFSEGNWLSVYQQSPWDQFIEMMDAGDSRITIQDELGMSRATYFRYKKKYDANPMRVRVSE